MASSTRMKNTVALSLAHATPYEVSSSDSGDSVPVARSRKRMVKRSPPVVSVE